MSENKTTYTAPGAESGLLHYDHNTIPQAAAINQLAEICHEANKKWWLDLNKQCVHCWGKGSLSPAGISCDSCGGTGYSRANRNVPEMLMLCVSELAEALEGHRKNLPDDKLPHRRMFEVELTDCLIRIFDLGAGLGLDLGRAFVEKMAYNASRTDHTIAHRLTETGKKY